MYFKLVYVSNNEEAELCYNSSSICYVKLMDESLLGTDEVKPFFRYVPSVCVINLIHDVDIVKTIQWMKYNEVRSIKVMKIGNYPRLDIFIQELVENMGDTLLELYLDHDDDVLNDRHIKQICTMTSLRCLHLIRCNKITSVDCVTNLTQLESFCIYDSQITRLPRFYNLKHFECISCLKLSNINELENVSTLKEVKLNALKISTITPLVKSIKNSLETLHIEVCNELQSLDVLEEAVHMKSLTLRNMWNILIDPVRNCKSLKYLYIYKINVKDCTPYEFFTELAGTLTHITIDRLIDFTDLYILSECKKLERIIINACNDLTSLQGVEMLPLIDTIILNYCRKYLDIKELSKTNLKSFKIIEGLDMLQYRYLPESLEKLSINIKDNFDVKDIVHLRRLKKFSYTGYHAGNIKNISLLPHTLEYLTLRSIGSFDVDILNKFTNLKSLTLTALNIPSLDSIRNARHLETLSLCFIHGITDLDVIKYLHKLKVISIIVCTDLTTIFLNNNDKEVKKGFPYMIVFDLFTTNVKKFNSIKYMPNLIVNHIR